MWTDVCGGVAWRLCGCGCRRRALHEWPKDLQCPVLLCGTSLSFPFAAFVPRDTNLFHNSGMDGWFTQDRHLLFRARFESFCLPFYAAGLCDSHPEGRVGKIIDKSLAKQRPFLASYFQSFQRIKCMTCEILKVQDDTNESAVFPSRCMDDNYVCLLNVPVDSLDAVREPMKRFFAAIYCIPMKWEPEGYLLLGVKAPFSLQAHLF